MLRPNATIEQFHARQAGCLPDRYGLRVTELSQGRLQAQFEVQPWRLARAKKTHSGKRVGGVKFFKEERRWDWCWSFALFGVVFLAGRCGPSSAICVVDPV